MFEFFVKNIDYSHNVQRITIIYLFSKIKNIANSSQNSWKKTSF